MPPEDQTNDKDFDEACRFIIKLGTMAHGYGPNAIRLESYLSRLTLALGYHGVFRSTPTEMVFTLSKKQGAWQRHHIATMPGTGLDLANLFGTIIAVIFANIWGKVTDRSTSIVLLPAIVLLVSGSIGFRGLAAISVGQTATGEQQFVQMFVVALTIAAGLLVGNTIVRPKATL